MDFKQDKLVPAILWPHDLPPLLLSRGLRNRWLLSDKENALNRQVESRSFASK